MRGESTTSERLVSPIGHLYFLLFVALAGFLFQERVIVGDSAFQVFQMIQTGDFGLYSNRYSNFIAQSLPLAAVHLKLPLNAVLVLYAVAPVLVCYSCFCLALHVLKDRKAALTMVLASCIMLTQGFYFATFEVNQAVCVLTLAHSLMRRQQPFQVRHWLFLGLGVALAVFFHPLAFIGIAFIWGYAFLQNPSLKNRRLLGMLALGVLVVVIKALFLTNSYESDKISPLGLFKRIGQLPRLESPETFTRWLFRDYYWLLVFSALSLTAYFRQKKWLLFGWYVVAAGGFWLLMLLANPQAGDPDKFYLELHLQLLALMAALPLVHDVLPAFFRAAWFPAALATVLLSRLVVMYISQTAFSGRLQWYDKIYNYTSRYPETRFVVHEANVPGLKEQNRLIWASAYESLLYFASSHRQPQKTIFIAGNPNEIGYLAYTPGLFASAFQAFPATDLPARYFFLKPTPYRFLNTPPAGALPAVTLTPLVQELSGNPGNTVALPLQIKAAGLLPSALSGEKAPSLSYRLYRNDQEIAANTIRTPLEADVTGVYKQDLLIEAPETKGTYQVKLFLLPEDPGFWNREPVTLLVE